MSVLSAALKKRNDAAMQQARESLGEIQKAWEALEQEFRNVGILKTTSRHFESIYDSADHHGVHDPVGEVLIGVAKIKGQWRVCLGSYYYQNDNEPSWTPIVDCTMDDRIKGFKQVKELMKAVVESNEKAAKELDKAVGDASKLLKEMGIELAPDRSGNASA